MTTCPLDDEPERKQAIVRAFPKLTIDSFRITSYDSLSDPEGKLYNCIAWAVGKTDAWWWPDPDIGDAHWPSGVSKEPSLASFIAAFATEGFEVCSDNDPSLDPGFEKVAIYVDSTTKQPTHAARQMKHGRWSSKLGPEEDIEHGYDDLTGDRESEFGEIAVIMRRAITPSSVSD